MARTLCAEAAAARARRRTHAATTGCSAVRLRLSARDGARASRAPFTYEVDDGVGKGAIVAVPFGAAARARDRRRGRGGAARGDRRRCRSSASSAQMPPALVDLALWLADYYGSTPARALALVAPDAPKRRKEQAPPAERQSLAGEAEPLELSDEQRAAVARIVAAIDAGGGTFLLHGATGSGKTEVYLQALRRGARARARRDRARAGDRARAADGRPRPRPLRRARRDPALGADRRRAPRRARADRERARRASSSAPARRSSRRCAASG